MKKTTKSSQVQLENKLTDYLFDKVIENVEMSNGSFQFFKSLFACDVWVFLDENNITLEDINISFEYIFNKVLYRVNSELVCPKNYDLKQVVLN